MLEDYAVASFNKEGKLVQYAENPYINFIGHWPLYEILNWYAQGTHRNKVLVDLDAGTFYSRELEWLRYRNFKKGMDVTICLEDDNAELFDIVRTRTIGTLELEFRNNE